MEKPVRPKWFPANLYESMDKFEKEWFGECSKIVGEIYQSNPKARKEIPDFIKAVEVYYNSNRNK